MSGFYLLALIAIWLFVGRGIYRFWKKWQPSVFSRKTLRIGIGILLFSIWFGGGFWQTAGKKMYWDSKVREMCAKDGGIKVYETVELPTDQFDKWGMVLFYHPIMNEQALGPKYKLKEKTIYLREKKPAVIRCHYSIFRQADGKILGETVRYSRRGGDLPGFGHGSSFACPDHAGINKLIKAVLVESIGGQE